MSDVTEEATQRLAALEADLLELAGRLEVLVDVLDRPARAPLQVHGASVALRHVLHAIRHRLRALRMPASPPESVPERPPASA